MAAAKTSRDQVTGPSLTLSLSLAKSPLAHEFERSENAVNRLSALVSGNHGAK
ncbi:protein of unknown function [Candidatus Filomicrobium marinum]|uniref:Uncharacterized protein n=1 Tax=Candidatus Filomicrobium marinum TaxID=1608628 RepID=A0A0D6JDP0_9HYPH|nr:protein of unknown function [Candidatus Filomicrobium marinum]CPR17488.1 protein of unknown function [Candidatus Filomicrobium marinum]